MNDMMKKKLVLRTHEIILLILILASLAAFIIFFFFLGGEALGPLFKKANMIDFNLLLVRRIVALLAWMIFSFFAVYYGTTVQKDSQFHETIHLGILTTFILSILYSIRQITILALENHTQLRIIRLLYVTDASIVVFGFTLYLLLLYWVPKVREAKNSD